MFEDLFKLASRYDDNHKIGTNWPRVTTTATHTSFPITFGSIEAFFELEKPKVWNECVKAPKKAKGGRNLKVNGCGQLENCCVILSYFSGWGILRRQERKHSIELQELKVNKLQML